MNPISSRQAAIVAVALGGALVTFSPALAGREPDRTKSSSSSSHEDRRAPAPASAPRVEHRAPQYSSPAPRYNSPSPRYSSPAPRVEYHAPQYNIPSPRYNTPSPRYSAPAPRREYQIPTYQQPNRGSYQPSYAPGRSADPPSPETIDQELKRTRIYGRIPRRSGPVVTNPGSGSSTTNPAPSYTNPGPRPTYNNNGSGPSYTIPGPGSTYNNNSSGASNTSSRPSINGGSSGSSARGPRYDVYGDIHRPRIDVSNGDRDSGDRIILGRPDIRPPHIDVRQAPVYVPRPHYNPYCRPGYGDSTVIINEPYHRPWYDPYPSPYDPPVTVVYAPQPQPQVVYVPADPQVVYVPSDPQVIYVPQEPQVIYVPQPGAPATQNPPAPVNAGSTTPYTPQEDVPTAPMPAGAEKAIVDIQESWILADDSLIAKHLDPTRKVRIFRDGKLDFAATSDDFISMTRKGLETLATQSFVLNSRTLVQDGRVRASGKHVFYDPDSQRQTNYVSFWLEQAGDHWIITAVDTSDQPDHLGAFIDKQ